MPDHARKEAIMDIDSLILRKRLSPSFRKWVAARARRLALRRRVA